MKEEDIAQIAILQPPFEGTEEDAYDDVTGEMPEFIWLRKVTGCGVYIEDEIHEILKEAGFATYLERLNQIQCALQYQKLEVSEGLYQLYPSCF